MGEQAVEGYVHAIRVAGISEESPCLVGVTVSGIWPAAGSAGLTGRSGEGGPFVLEVVAPGREVVNEGEAEALIEDIVDPVPVDSQVHCMANPGVANRGFLGGSVPGAALVGQTRRRRRVSSRREGAVGGSVVRAERLVSEVDETEALVNAGQGAYVSVETCTFNDLTLGANEGYDVRLVGKQHGLAGGGFTNLKDLEFVESRGNAPVVFHTLVEECTVDLMEDVAPGAVTNGVDPVALFAANVFPVLPAHDAGGTTRRRAGRQRPG